ncbi:MAG TPA: RluA family pseudouridine synthase [Planctomycetaceae bacterium]|nr:RluA family pseudouridine synthase [Planctomycetaceae bacterium]
MPESLSDRPIELTVEARAHGWRVDHYLSRLFPNYSRSLLQKAIEAEAVLVNGLPVKPSRRLRVNDCVSLRLPELPDNTLPAEDIPIEVLYEDDALVVVNKPAGMIVHPGKGNYRGTLAGALQFHFDRLSDIAGRLRPGIVHRLDRDTSGVLVVAKDNQVHHRLSAQFEQREVVKEYRAITWGVFDVDSDYIETHVRVHPRHREKMQVCPEGGPARPAVTFYEVVERFDGFTHVRLFPRTGRTHQLRLHMQYIGHPIVADRLYGGQDCLRLEDVVPESARRAQIAHGKGPRAARGTILIDRQTLHAFRLRFRHPRTGKVLEFEAPWPQDFERTLNALRRHRTRQP